MLCPYATIIPTFHASSLTRQKLGNCMHSEAVQASVGMTKMTIQLAQS